jgi:hypothetical protein
MNKAALALSGLIAACTVGVAGPPTQEQPDANPLADAPVSNGCVDRSATPGVAHIHSAGNTTNAGQGCVAALCHLANNVGPGAPGFQFAGTLYKPDGTTPNAGANIKITAADGVTTKSTVADDAGNFYILAGSLPQAFPAHASATACPNLTPMSDPLTQNSAPAIGGNCNGCHGNPATGGTGVLTLSP